MQYSLISILEKESRKRRPIVVLHSPSTSRKNLMKVLKFSLICPEDYDFRTIKVHTNLEIFNCSTPYCDIIHYVDDELNIN